MDNRKKYFLCRYRRTERIVEGRCFHVGDSIMSDLPIAPSYVYELYRASSPLYLTAQEAIELDNALSIEGCPTLLSEEQAIEGKAL